MIKLSSSKNEKEYIQKLIKKAIGNKNSELECILMDDISKNQNINYQQFVNIIKRVKSKKKYTSQNEKISLDIYFPIDSKYHNIRCVIRGYGAISNYCNHESITNILNNVIFQRKKIDNMDDKINIPNYNLKFNLKKENKLDKDDAIIRDLIRDWNKELKTYRYKKRYSFTSIDKEFKVDLSIIKSSAKSQQYLTVDEIYQRNLFNNVTKPDDVRGGFSSWWNTISKNKSEKILVKDVPTFFKNIDESYVFNNQSEYEAEVEYIGNQKEYHLTDTKSTNDKVTSTFNNFFSHVGTVMQAIQDSFFVISNQEKIQLEKNLQNLIDKAIRQNNNDFKKDSRNNNKNDDDSKSKSGGGKDDDDESSKANVFIKNNLKFNKHRLFFGPLAVDLSYENIAPIYDTKLTNNIVNTNNNIRLNYLVTDKADGERNLLVINDKGQCYGINRANRIKSFGVTLPRFANSIFDIEYITKTETGKTCNNIYIFDCYISEGKYCMNKAFLWNKEGGRHHCLLQLEKYIKNGDDIVHNNEKFPTRIFTKNYYPSDSPKTLNKQETPQIFTSCKQILSKINVKYGGFIEDGHEFTYATDGLIFIPNNLAIYQENTTDQIYNPFVSKSWYMNYKLKNSGDLTIDFKVEFIKSLDTKTINYTYYNNKKYIQLNLYSKVYQNSLPNQLNYMLLNDGITSRSIPNNFLFQPSHPFNGFIDDDNKLVNTSHFCNLEVDISGNIYCENRDIITDGSIIEFRYIPKDKDAELDGQFRWVPVRTRTNYNSFNIASDIWRLIHTPISKELISTKHKDIETSPLVPYYKFNYHRKYVSQPLKEFNNYVKNYLIERVLSGLYKPFVLDLACGKMGDFFKYVKHGAFFLVGVDIDPDNLHNKNDGAATRIVNNIDKNVNISKLATRTMLINGDVTKSIQGGDAGMDIMNKYYLDILYGRVKSSNNKHRKLFNNATEGFHMVSCMYSIHYMMNTEESLSGFLLNVSENLRDQGFFIGTCLDGPSLVKMFKGTGEIIGEVDGELVYKINKVEGEIYDNLTVGNKVNIYYETFNNMLPENLVDITYLEEKAMEYNLKLVESNLFLDEPGNLLSAYRGLDDSQDGGENNKSTNKKNKANYDAINKNEDLKDWASLNRYFIFQKVDRLSDD